MKFYRRIWSFITSLSLSDTYHHQHLTVVLKISVISGSFLSKYNLADDKSEHIDSKLLAFSLQHLFGTELVFIIFFVDSYRNSAATFCVESTCICCLCSCRWRRFICLSCWRKSWMMRRSQNGDIGSSMWGIEVLSNCCKRRGCLSIALRMLLDGKRIVERL